MNNEIEDAKEWAAIPNSPIPKDIPNNSMQEMFKLFKEV